MKTETLEDFLADELKEIYNAENQLIKALPKLVEIAHSNDLHHVLAKYVEETQDHVEYIEDIFAQLEIALTARKSIGMAGLVDESKEVLKSDLGINLLDVALIGGTQRMIHYQIAFYGTARAHARQLGLINIASRLARILEEEKKMDEQLTELAKNRINVQAAMYQGNLMM